jgi:DNA-binding NarL/FixJ family response regulator
MLVRCLVIDDDAHDRELVARMVVKAGHEAEAAASAERALELARDQRFEVALVDLSMPGTDGMTTLRLLRRDHPDLRLLVVSGYDDRPHVIGAVAAGADGYVLKTDLGDRLKAALDDVAEGGGPMSARIAHFVLEELRATDEEQRRARQAERVLSERNWEVLKGLSRGLTYRTIASDLNITVNTVRHHVRAIYAKLDAKGRNDAVARALGDSAPLPVQPEKRQRKRRPAGDAAEGSSPDEPGEPGADD